MTWPGITIFSVECGELVEGWTEADHLTRLIATGVITPEELQSVATPEA